MTVKTRQSISNRLRDMVKSNPQAVKVAESDIILPVDDQAGYATTVQTHTNQAIVNGVGNTSAWIDTDGFSEVGFTFFNSVNASSIVDIDWSNDGVSLQGRLSAVAPSAVEQYRTGEAKTRARYVRLNIFNSHTAPITANSWIYLKA